jgi:hypothetical protein
LRFSTSVANSISWRIRKDDVAVPSDDAEPVAVAVERKADLGAGPLDRADQLGQVLRLARVGMVIREIAIDL